MFHHLLPQKPPLDSNHNKANNHKKAALMLASIKPKETHHLLLQQQIAEARLLHHPVDNDYLINQDKVLIKLILKRLHKY